MNVRAPRNVTVSMCGWIEVFAPVFESKVNELNVIPMNWLRRAEQHELEFRRARHVSSRSSGLGLEIGV